MFDCAEGHHSQSSSTLFNRVCVCTSYALLLQLILTGLFFPHHPQTPFTRILTFNECQPPYKSLLYSSQLSFPPLGFHYTYLYLYQY